MITAAELRAKYQPFYQIGQIEGRIVAAASVGVDRCFGFDSYCLTPDLRLELEAAGYKLTVEENGSLTISWES